jgi:hypothetical protein
MKKFLLALVIALVPSLAWAQGAVLQNGPVIKFDLPGWVQDKTIMSGGKMFTDNFRGFNPAHFFDGGGSFGVCTENALTNVPYSSLCLGHDANGNGVISNQVFNGAGNPGLNFSILGPLTLSGSTLNFVAGGSTIATGSASGLALFGTPTAPTPTGGDNSTRLATTAFVNTAVGSGAVAAIPVATTNAALAATPQATTTRVMRLGITAQGDSPPLVFNGQTGTCAAAGLANDIGSCVNGPDGNSWKASFEGQVSAAYFGLHAANISFHSITTVVGSCAIVDASGGWSSANIGDLIDIAGAGPNELHLITSVTAVADATHFTTAACPTLAMEASGVVVHHGKDNVTALNAAAAAARARFINMKVPAGEYLVSGPIQCNVVDYNSYNLPQPACIGDPGSIIKAMSNMSTSLPAVDAGTLFTIGGFANGSDYSQYIRAAFIDGGGLTLDCSFICNYAFSLPFSLDSGIQNLTAKNSLVGGFHIGAVGAPQATGGILASRLHVERDTYFTPISDITHTTVPVVTTTRDHGVATGRIVTVIGANNVPGSVTGEGPISFIAKSTGARTLELHNVNGSTWAAFSGTAQLYLTAPTNVIPAPVFGITAANPAQISTQGDLNMANGQTWCIYGAGVSGANGTTTAPTNVPDGCYVISNVSAPGGDGPFTFTVPVNSAGITFTGGGITYRKDTIADAGIYLDNVSDVQVNDSFITGTRWPIYNNPALGGYGGKYSHNHSYSFPEHGWITAAHVLGGKNSLIGEQVDGPAIFGAQFSAGGNSSTGFGFNGGFGFPFIPDGREWVFQIDSITDSALTASGTNAHGVSNTIRANILANHFTAGSPNYYGAISNYQQFGYADYHGPITTILYPMPDSGRLKPAFQGIPGGFYGTTSLTPVATGNGAGCRIIPRYSGNMRFEISGTVNNNTVGDGAYAQLYYGTGTAPIAGAAFGGGTASLGNSRGLLAEPTGGGGMTVPFTTSGVAAVTLNTPYWFDASIRAVTGGTATISDLDCNAQEQ